MVDDTPLISDSLNGGRKLGHSICGCCCDSRRGVIVISIILLILSVIQAIVGGVNVGGKWDQMPEHKSYYMWLLIGGIVAVLIHASIIGGALKYNPAPAYLGIVWAILNLVVDGVYYSKYDGYYYNANGQLIQYNWVGSLVFGVLVAVFWIYVYLVFIMEVRSGKMSQDNYPREKQSCCCV